MRDSFVYEDWVYNYEAAQEVLPVVLELFKPQSILDVGCGTGTWLKVAQELGVREIFGLDDPRNDKSILKIQEQNYLGIDLSQSFDLKRRFDLILCLEVAEHLPASSAEGLISSLVQHSDTILFSAAIPGQGGQNHINEQWPEYWASLFGKFNFNYFDALRPIFWSDEKVDLWYKQNLIIYSKHDLTSSFPVMIPRLLPLVHPDLLKLKQSEIESLKQTVELVRHQQPGVRKAFKLFRNALQKKIGFGPVKE